MTTYAPNHIIPLNHRLVKPTRTMPIVARPNPFVPILLTVGKVMARITIQIGYIVLWFFQFGISINFRYGRYIVTHDNSPVLGVDFTGCLFGSFVVVNSPFGWE